MASKAAHHDKQFKLDAIKYVKEHPDLTLSECCKNLGIGLSTLSRWKSQYNDNDGDIPARGSGNYASDEQKEIARLKRELRNTQDALDVLKKLSAFWEKTDNCHLYRGRCQGGGIKSCQTSCLRLRNAEIFRRFPFWFSCFLESQAFRY